MRIRITRELVKELNGARRRLSAGKVMELRDPDAADLIANGYAEPFPEADAPVASVTPQTAPVEPVVEVVDEDIEDSKPSKRAR